MKNRDMSDIITELQGISNNLLVLGNYVEADDSVDRPTPQTMSDAIWANMRHLDYVIHELGDYDTVYAADKLKFTELMSKISEADKSMDLSHSDLESYNFGEYAIHRIALAKNEQAMKQSLKDGYMVLFSPSKNNISAWVLIRE